MVTMTEAIEHGLECYFADYWQAYVAHMRAIDQELYAWITRGT